MATLYQIYKGTDGRTDRQTPCGCNTALLDDNTVSFRLHLSTRLSCFICIVLEYLCRRGTPPADGGKVNDAGVL